MMTGRNDDQADQLDWNSLSNSQKDLVAKSIIKLRLWKFALLGCVTVFSLVQSPLSNYYANKSAEKQVELSKLEKVLELQGKSTENAMANLLTLSAQMGELKLQNELLKKRIVELEESQTKLRSEKDELANQIKTLRNE